MLDAMMLLAFLLFLDQSLAAHKGSNEEICLIEVSKLRYQLQRLQNRFLLGEWQLRNLKKYNPHWIKENTKAEKNEQSTESQPNASHPIAYHHGKYMVKIDLADWNGEKRFATYEKFNISDESDKYRLTFGIYGGNAGDALSGGLRPDVQWSASLNGMQFSTPDQDNDRYLQGSCSQENESGWWFNRCNSANLNGKYYQHGNYTAKNDNGIVWCPWTGWWYSLKFTAMKVRPLYFFPSAGSGDHGNKIGS
ncbi:fibrinogen like 1B [Mustelus asterias]